MKVLAKLFQEHLGYQRHPSILHLENGVLKHEFLIPVIAQTLILNLVEIELLIFLKYTFLIFPYHFEEFQKALLQNVV